MSDRPCVLIAIPDPETRKTLNRELAKSGFEPVYCTSHDGVRAALVHECVGIVFCSIRLSDCSFRDVLRLARSGKEEVPVIVCSDYCDKALYNEALRLGAFDFITCPYRRVEIERVVRRVLPTKSVPDLVSRQRCRGSTRAQLDAVGIPTHTGSEGESNVVSSKHGVADSDSSAFVN